MTMGGKIMTRSSKYTMVATLFAVGLAVLLLNNKLVFSLLMSVLYLSPVLAVAGVILAAGT
jgi:hypothetical protein